MLEKLYYYFYEHSDELPSEYRKIARIESVGRASADYISGMTDRYGSEPSGRYSCGSLVRELTKGQESN